MKKLTLTFFLGMQLFLIIAGPCLATDRSLSYDDVRKEAGFKENGFSASSLRDVIEIFPEDANAILTRLEIDSLTNSTSLKNLKTLDLSNQTEIKDEDIEILARNKTFAKIMTLKLTDAGPRITNKAITHILNSPFLGSIRDLPQISGRHGRPASVITVYARGTGVTNKEPPPKFNFHIEYRPPNPAVTWAPDEHGIKIVEVWCT